MREDIVIGQEYIQQTAQRASDLGLFILRSWGGDVVYILVIRIYGWYLGSRRIKVKSGIVESQLG